MKKIIKNRLYDTDTAKLIGKYTFSNRTDFKYFEETLYCKKTGEYFLYGEGGPLSKYAVSVGTNEISGSEKILPLTDDNAKAWAEEYLDADTYIKEFGEIEEQSDTSSKIKKLRQMTGCNQDEFAKKYNIPIRTIRSWEAGDRVPPEYVVDLLNFRIKNEH